LKQALKNMSIPSRRTAVLRLWQSVMGAKVIRTQSGNEVIEDFYLDYARVYYKTH
jgi:hypothetical protein